MHKIIFICLLSSICILAIGQRNDLSHPRFRTANESRVPEQVSTSETLNKLTALYNNQRNTVVIPLDGNYRDIQTGKLISFIILKSMSSWIGVRESLIVLALQIVSSSIKANGSTVTVVHNVIDDVTGQEIKIIIKKTFP